ncbi:MAG: hypothetical protein JO266_14770 [Acidobacteria bacterium]|nr:hypothetical protein [Acidobacteriota bacterium]MBV9481986.1 hypothetical protein [Acidobacteriota bacterium]
MQLIGQDRIEAHFRGLHVGDHKDRDTHQFFLEFQGRRLTNMAETLEQLLGPQRRGAKFNLVEQITPGATTA